MVTIRPIPRALVPVDASAAQQISAPNYDEFQSDREIWDIIQARPHCVLTITMSHCDDPNFDTILEDGSPEALDRSLVNMNKLVDSPLTHVVDNALFVYEVVSPKRPDVRQIGLGGCARTSEIRTDATPDGTIVRNEGIRQEKADGRARLIAKTSAYIGNVNCAVQDKTGQMLQSLERVADSRDSDFAATDEAGNVHRVWLVTDAPTQQELTSLLAAEPAAYVADGNHRSAAAAALKKEDFLCVFFPTARLRLEPYNRLVEDVGVSADELLEKLGANFTIETVGDQPAYRPSQIHEIGLYLPGTWYKLTPKAGTFDPENAAESIDSDILQRHFLDAALGIADARDKRINFVGGNKDSAWLRQQVDAGDYALAISVAPVTMEQFIAVCEQNRFMPPKSTWFDPKIRSGMVMSLLD
ncbi:MAG: DUF1015 family protein [Planctomycetaceae bacterium]